MPKLILNALYLVEGHTFIPCDHAHAGIERVKSYYEQTLWTLEDFDKFMKKVDYNHIWIETIYDYTAGCTGKGKNMRGIDSSREIKIVKGNSNVYYRKDYSAFKARSYFLKQLAINISNLFRG